MEEVEAGGGHRSQGPGPPAHGHSRRIPRCAIEVDRQLIAAALANLLQNAFKFSRPNGHVVLRTDTVTAAGRVLIEVEDECGGLPPGRAEDLFRPFEQHGADRSGLGLGLTIARRERRGQRRPDPCPQPARPGCIFTIDLPRRALVALTVSTRDPTATTAA